MSSFFLVLSKYFDSTKKSELRADVFDRGPDLGLFVHGQVVEDHHITGPERGHQDLFDIREETRIVDRAIEDRRRGQCVQPQCGGHGVCLPMAAGRVITESRAAETAP